MARQTGLGRGLGALIPGDGEAPRAESGSVAYRELPVGAIDVNPFQPREHFDEAALSTLTASIREVGVLQPVLVRAKGPVYLESSLSSQGGIDREKNDFPRQLGHPGVELEELLLKFEVFSV